MNLLTRYLIVRLALMSCYALLSILALYSFIDFLSEVGNIGDGNYTFFTAVQYIAMKMPARAYELMPLATLIGGLAALSQLSANSELAVIKTSGLSTAQLIGIMVQFSAIFALITILLGEWAAPQLSRRADMLKTSARNEIAASLSGVWLKQPQAMIHVASMLPDNTLVGIKIWHYNDDFKLSQAIAADTAQVSDKQWILHHARSSLLSDHAIQTEQHKQLAWPTPVNQQLLDVLLVQPEQMSFITLHQYIGYLKSNGQQTQMYRVAWWHKLIYPIATMVMALVALAFTPISGRHTNMGLKLFGGVCLGLLFFFTGRFFGFTTQLYGVPAFVSALLPTTAFALWAVYLIRKQEKR